MNISKLKTDLISLGLEDNLSLAVLLYLAGTARKTPYKISVLVNGPAGLGKSHLTKTVLNLFPQKNIISCSRMTPAYLVRQGDLSGKVLFIYEKYEDPQFAQYIRELITEGEVTYSTVSGEYRLQGPTTLIETSVNSDMFDIEDRSRYFVAEINTSREARDNIATKQKRYRTIEGLRFRRLNKSIEEEHRIFQEKLSRNLCVIIPFAEEINFRSNAYHAPRIRERVLNLISVITYLQQEDRHIIEEYRDFRLIEATRDDFTEAKQILTDIRLDEDDVLLPRDVLGFMDALRANRKELSQNRTFSRNQVIKVLSVSEQFGSYKVITRYLRALVEVGVINELPVRGLKNKVEYSFSSDFPVNPSENYVGNCYASLSLA